MSIATLSAKAEDVRPWSGALEFKALAETLPSLVFASDAHGHNVYVNASFQRYTGLSTDELLGGGWLSILHFDDRASAIATWDTSWTEGELYDTRYRLRRFDGEYRWHLVRGAPIRDTRGEILRWIGSCTDVDDMVASIANRSQSAAILDGLGKTDGLVLYAKDADGRFIYANDATLKVIGRGVDQVLGECADGLSVSQADAVAIRENDDLVILTGSPIIVEESWVDSDGVSKVFRSFKTPMVLPDGQKGIAAASVDVTLEHGLVTAFEQQVMLHRQQLDSIPVVIWEADARGNLTAANQQWRESVGLPTGTLDFADLVCNEVLEGFLSQWSFAVDNSEILDFPTRIRDCIFMEGREVRALAFPVRGTAGSEESSRWFGCFI